MMWIATWLTSFGILGAPTADQLIALEVGRVITVSGEDLENVTILVDAGRIREVGKGIDVPASARVFRMPGAVAMPGLVYCHSTTGMRVPNERMADVPFIDVRDGIDPSSPGLENALRDGVTTVHVMPANVTRFGGQGAVIRPHGSLVDEMVVKAPSALKLSLSPPYSETRMSNMASLRKAFYSLYERMRALQTQGEDPQPLAGKPDAEPTLESLLGMKPAWNEILWDKIPRDKIAERDRPLVDLVRGKLPVFIYCSQASDVFKAFELIDTNGLKATLVLGSDAWKVKDVLAARKGLGSVVLSPTLEVWETDSESGREKRHLTPLLLHRAGVRFALQVVEDRRSNRGPTFSRRGEYRLWYQAATLVKYGVPRREALRSITLTPAEIIGLEHRLGSIEKGKDANIAVFSGDPLDARSWVELVLVEGDVVYRKSEDKDLELLLKATHRRF